MGNRYWEACAVPDAVLDWVNENVVAAIKDFWAGEEPVVWVDSKGGRMVFTVGGPGRPTEKDPSGESDVYTLTFDMLEELTYYIDPHEDISGPLNDDMREEIRWRAAELRKLAEDIAGLAQKAERTANDRGEA